MLTAGAWQGTLPHLVSAEKLHHKKSCAVLSNTFKIQIPVENLLMEQRPTDETGHHNTPPIYPDTLSEIAYILICH